MKRVIQIGMTPFIIIAMDNVLIIALNTVIQRLGGPGQGDTLLTCTTTVSYTHLDVYKRQLCNR